MRRRFLLPAALFAAGVVSGWLMHTGRVAAQQRGRQSAAFTRGECIPERIGISKQQGYSAVSGMYRPYLYSERGRIIRLADNPPDGADVWVLTFGPHVVVHVVRDDR